MRAIQVNRLGGPEVLEITHIPVPEPRPGWVRLRVKAVGLNFADILNVRGEYLTRARVPFIPGMEFSGVVDTLGEGVPASGVGGLQVGQLVAALGGTGAFAEYSCVPAAAILPMPPNLGPKEAAALPVSYYTAFFSLRTLGQARAGETVLVEAAAGALGTASIQLARAMNLRVIATASSEPKLELARSLGADEAFLSDREDLRDAVMAATDGKGADVYLSVVGGPGFQDRIVTMMNSRGRVMVIGNASREQSSLNPTALMKKNMSVIGVWLTPLLQEAEVMREATAFIAPLIASGSVKPIVGQTFPLEKAGDAFEFVFSRASTGKVIIEP